MAFLRTIKTGIIERKEAGYREIIEEKKVVSLSIHFQPN
jgi:hypothetical protein